MSTPCTNFSSLTKIAWWWHFQDNLCSQYRASWFKCYTPMASWTPYNIEKQSLKVRRIRHSSKQNSYHDLKYTGTVMTIVQHGILMHSGVDTLILFQWGHQVDTDKQSSLVCAKCKLSPELLLGHQHTMKPATDVKVHHWIKPLNLSTAVKGPWWWWKQLVAMEGQLHN